MLNGINSVPGTSATTVSNNSSQYSVNLSVICDSCDPHNINYGKFTQQQINDAWNQRNAREYAAFGYLAGDASPQGIAKFASAYINYINSLSPAEQNSASYQGTKESATALLAAANSQIVAGPYSGDKTAQPKTLLQMMLDAMLNNLKKSSINVGAASNAANSGVQVTFSDAAQNISDLA